MNPAADLNALEQHAYRLLQQAGEESRAGAGQNARLRAAALQPERIERIEESHESHESPPPVPLAFQLWLAYLLWFDEALQSLPGCFVDVRASELAGLTALNRARARFIREHRSCPHCEALNSRHARRCRRCAQEL